MSKTNFKCNYSMDFQVDTRVGMSNRVLDFDVGFRSR